METDIIVTLIEKSALGGLVVFMFLKTRGLTTECLAVIKESVRSNEAIIRLLEDMTGRGLRGK